MGAIALALVVREDLATVRPRGRIPIRTIEAVVNHKDLYAGGRDGEIGAKMLRFRMGLILVVHFGLDFERELWEIQEPRDETPPGRDWHRPEAVAADGRDNVSLHRPCSF